MIDEPWTPEGTTNLPQQHDPNGIEIDTSGYDRVPASTLAPGSVFLWLGVDCTVTEVQSVELNLVRLTYRHEKDGATYDVVFGNITNMLVKHEQESDAKSDR